MVYKIILLVTLIIHFTNSELKSESIVNGRWISDDGFVEFFENRNYLYHIDNFQLEGVYELSAAGDTLTLQTQFGFEIKFHYLIVGNNLIFYSYKSETGELKNHIDEIKTFRKAENALSVLSGIFPTEKFIIPANYSGLILINYTGKNSAPDNNTQDKVIIIGNTGKEQTDFKESVISYALCKYKFVQNNKEVPYFLHHQITDSLLNSLPQDSVYVCMFGFNQIGREEINKMYKKEIAGNVLMFSIDTLKRINTKFLSY